MRYLVLLRDSLREALDRKSFYVLLAISALFVVASASVSFRPLEESEAIQSIVNGFGVVGGGGGFAGEPWHVSYEVAFEAAGVQAARERGDTRHRFRLKASPPEEMHRLVRHWAAVQDRKVKEKGDAVPDADLPTDFELQKKFLRARFREALLMNVELSPAGEAEWDASVRVAGRRVLAGAEEMSLFFGLVRFRPRWPDPNTGMEGYRSSAEVVNLIHNQMAETLAGWVGMIVALVVTAGFIPNMLQKGTVDVLLSKPVRRSTLFVYKYLGGCTYVLLNAAFLIGGSWLALSARTGHWNLYFPLTILNLTFFFAVLYSISALMGVLTRSFAASCFVTLAAWAACSTLGLIHALLAAAAPGSVPPAIVTGVRFVYLLVPKTFDLSRLNDEICARGTLGEAAVQAIPSFLAPLSPWVTYGTSALFALVMVGFACERFSKRDY